MQVKEEYRRYVVDEFERLDNIIEEILILNEKGLQINIIEVEEYKLNEFLDQYNILAEQDYDDIYEYGQKEPSKQLLEEYFGCVIEVIKDK